MKKIILLGGEGYIGQVVNLFFQKKKYDISVVDNLIYDQKILKKNIIKKNKYDFYKSDHTNLKKNPKFLKNAIIVILSGLVGDPITKKYKNVANEINLKGLKSFLSFCFKIEVKQIIFVSTCSNYGLMKHGKIANEKTALKPLSSYSKSKVSIEKFLLKYKNKTKTIVTILRFATAFGLSPRMRFDLTINEFVKNIFFNKKFNVYDLNTWRPYCHVKDFARAIYTIISSKFYKINFEIFNVGSNKNNYTKKEIISKIAKYVQSNKIKYLGTGQDKRNYQVNFSKLSKKLNFKTLYSVDYGIKEIIGWLSKNKNKKFNKMGNYIINEKNL